MAAHLLTAASQGLWGTDKLPAPARFAAVFANAAAPKMGCRASEATPFRLERWAT